MVYMMKNALDNSMQITKRENRCVNDTWFWRSFNANSSALSWPVQNAGLFQYHTPLIRFLLKAGFRHRKRQDLLFRVNFDERQMVWYTKCFTTLPCKHKMVKPYSKPSQHPFRDSQETNQSQSNPQAVELEPAEEGVHCLGSKLHATWLHDLTCEQMHACKMCYMWTCFLNDATLWSFFFVGFDKYLNFQTGANQSCEVLTYKTLKPTLTFWSQQTFAWCAWNSSRNSMRMLCPCLGGKRPNYCAPRMVQPL